MPSSYSGNIYLSGLSSKLKYPCELTSLHQTCLMDQHSFHCVCPKIHDSDMLFTFFLLHARNTPSISPSKSLRCEKYSCSVYSILKKKNIWKHSITVREWQFCSVIMTQKDHLRYLSREKLGDVASSYRDFHTTEDLACLWNSKNYWIMMYAFPVSWTVHVLTNYLLMTIHRCSR